MSSRRSASPRRPLAPGLVLLLALTLNLGAAFLALRGLQSRGAGLPAWVCVAGLAGVLFVAGLFALRGGTRGERLAAAVSLCALGGLLTLTNAGLYAFLASRSLGSALGVMARSLPVSLASLACALLAGWALRPILGQAAPCPRARPTRPTVGAGRAAPIHPAVHRNAPPEPAEVSVASTITTAGLGMALPAAAGAPLETEASPARPESPWSGITSPEPVSLVPPRAAPAEAPPPVVQADRDDALRVGLSNFFTDSQRDVIEIEATWEPSALGHPTDTLEVTGTAPPPPAIDATDGPTESAVLAPLDLLDEGPAEAMDPPAATPAEAWPTEMPTEMAVTAAEATALDSVSVDPVPFHLPDETEAPVASAEPEPAWEPIHVPVADPAWGPIGSPADDAPVDPRSIEAAPAGVPMADEPARAPAALEGSGPMGAEAPIAHDQAAEPSAGAESLTVTPPASGAPALAATPPPVDPDALAAVFAPFGPLLSPEGPFEVGHAVATGVSLATVFPPGLARDALLAVAGRLLPALGGRSADGEPDAIDQVTIRGADGALVLTPLGTVDAGGPVLVAGARRRGALALLEILSRRVVVQYRGSHPEPRAGDGSAARRGSERLEPVPASLSIERIAESLEAFGPVSPGVLRDDAADLVLYLFLPAGAEVHTLGVLARDVYRAVDGRGSDDGIGALQSITLRVGGHRVFIRPVPIGAGAVTRLLAVRGRVGQAGLAGLQVERAAARLGGLALD